MKIPKNEKELVLFRLKVIPPSKRISIGSKGTFSRDELIDEVNKESEIGKKIVDIQMNFLRALKTGIIYGKE